MTRAFQRPRVRAPQSPRQATVRHLARHANIKDAQRPVTRPPHPGEEERITERRVRALNLRKAGASYRAIAAQLSVDVSTAWADVQAELTALRDLAVSEAEDVKALELQRLDSWMAGLAVKARDGDTRAVMALVRVSERRAKLLGLDAPQRLEHTGPEGRPVQVEPVVARVLNTLPPAKLLQLRALVAAAQAPDPDAPL